MVRLGGSVISTENAKESSAAAKGESIEDAVRVIGQYADAIVLRHPEDNTAKVASMVSPVPIINAGDGGNEHPTQGLLDLYTIQRERGSIDGMRIAIAGDIKNGRSVRSLCHLLGNYKNISVVFISPRDLAIKDDIKTHLTQSGVSYEETDDLANNIKDVDALYMMRIQAKHLTESDPSIVNNFILTRTHADSMREGAIIMHPLPRVDSIPTDIDSSPKAVYFRQAGYGVDIRMAILKKLLS